MGELVLSAASCPLIYGTMQESQVDIGLKLGGPTAVTGRPASLTARRTGFIRAVQAQLKLRWARTVARGASGVGRVADNEVS